MPHRFLPDSGHSSRFWWFPEELKMAERPANIAIPGVTYSRGIRPFQTCLSGPLNGMYESHPLSSSHLPLIAPVASKACILSHIDQWPHPMAQYHFDNFTSVLLASLYYIGSCELGGLSK